MIWTAVDALPAALGARRIWWQLSWTSPVNVINVFVSTFPASWLNWLRQHPASYPLNPTLWKSFTMATRNLVLCLDGTSNQFADKNSNVIKLFSVLHIDPGLNPDGQMAYYDSGVGTYLPVGASSTWSRARQEWGKNLDLAVAW